MSKTLCTQCLGKIPTRPLGMEQAWKMTPKFCIIPYSPKIPWIHVLLELN